DFHVTGVQTCALPIFWMKGNTQVGTGTSYQPTESGSYWVVLVDADDCKTYMPTAAVNYALRQPPFASISGSTSMCQGESTTLIEIGRASRRESGSRSA